MMPKSRCADTPTPVKVHSAAGHSHVDIFASYGGNGPDWFDHMADHVDDWQVDDGPAGSKPRLLSNTAP